MDTYTHAHAHDAQTHIAPHKIMDTHTRAIQTHYTCMHIHPHKSWTHIRIHILYIHPHKSGTHIHMHIIYTHTNHGYTYTCT